MTEDNSTQQGIAQPTMVSLNALNIVGCEGRFKPGASEDIGRLWTEFGPRMAEIGNRRGAATYGLCLMDNQGDGCFTYVAGVDVQSLDDLPDGMTGHQVPAREYAVFAHEHGIGPALRATLDQIFEQWLPGSGFVQDGPDFEYYDERFDPVSGQGTFFIYVPVRAANA